MQFLIGLTDVFDQARNQILLLDPLPSINKAYSMIMKVEAHKQVMNSCSQVVESVGLQVHSHGFKKESKKFEKKKGYCTYCNLEGHVSFRLVGYPEWYKGKKYARGNQQQPRSSVSNEANRRTAYMANTPMEDFPVDGSSKINEISCLLGTLQQEVKNADQRKGTNGSFSNCKSLSWCW